METWQVSVKASSVSNLRTIAHLPAHFWCELTIESAASPTARSPSASLSSGSGTAPDTGAMALHRWLN